MAISASRYLPLPRRALAPAAPLLAGVIGEAGRRQRRRHIFAATACAVAAAVALVVPGSPGGDTTAQRSGSPPTSAPVHAVLLRVPDLYVNCPVANSIACDRVHLSINLRRPATTVTASIAGWSTPLDYRGDQLTHTYRPRTEFDGLLQPVGIIHHLRVTPERGLTGRHYWFGDTGQPLIRIGLVIDYGHDNRVITHTTVALNAAGG